MESMRGQKVFSKTTDQIVQFIAGEDEDTHASRRVVNEYPVRFSTDSISPIRARAGRGGAPLCVAWQSAGRPVAPRQLGAHRWGSSVLRAPRDDMRRFRTAGCLAICSNGGHSSTPAPVPPHRGTSTRQSSARQRRREHREHPSCARCMRRHTTAASGHHCYCSQRTRGRGNHCARRIIGQPSS